MSARLFYYIWHRQGFSFGTHGWTCATALFRQRLRERAKCMCVRGLNVCTCVFACLNNDMEYGGTFAFEACRARVAISWAGKPHIKIFMSLGAVIAVLFILWSQGEVERGLEVREPVTAARLHWFLLHTTKPKATGQFCFPQAFWFPPTLLPCFPLPLSSQAGSGSPAVGATAGWHREARSSQLWCLI